MKVYTYTPKKYFGSNTYILISGSHGAVIDPSVSFAEASTLIKGLEVSIDYIILTHAHFDHMLKIDDWCDNTAAEVLVGVSESVALRNSIMNCYSLFMGMDTGYFGQYRVVSGGDVIRLGEESIKVIDTPGHSIGSISLVTDIGVFVGDVAFEGGGVGRTDLPGGDEEVLSMSIAKLKKLSPDTVIYSGHGNPTTVEKIRYI
jgi:glyoxylase-like metal-dependent hydrolase (beta-lactamase superfamily II)